MHFSGGRAGSFRPYNPAYLITELDARNVKAPPPFKVTAPKGAPNVIIVLLDDMGFGQRPGIQAIPSYSLLPRPNSTPIDMNQLRDVIRGQNIDAVVASRLVKVDKKVTYIPGQAYTPYPYYNTFYGYYGAIYPVLYSPDYLRVDKTAQIETNFYSTSKPDGELIWTGTSDTVNPRSPMKAIDAVAKLIVQQLETEKII